MHWCRLVLYYMSEWSKLTTPWILNFLPWMVLSFTSILTYHGHLGLRTSDSSYSLVSVNRDRESCRVWSTERWLHVRNLDWLSTHVRKRKPTYLGYKWFRLFTGYILSSFLLRLLSSPPCPVLEALGKSLSYEIAIGLNGRVWVLHPHLFFFCMFLTLDDSRIVCALYLSTIVGEPQVNAASPSTVILASNAIMNSEFLSGVQQKIMVEKLMKRLQWWLMLVDVVSR